MIMSLNPSVKAIRVNPAMEEYYRLFRECCKKGMDCRGFSVKLKDMKPEICGRTEIIM
jgi:hypothetical protein